MTLPFPFCISYSLFFILFFNARVAAASSSHGLLWSGTMPACPTTSVARRSPLRRCLSFPAHRCFCFPLARVRAAFTSSEWSSCGYSVLTRATSAAHGACCRHHRRRGCRRSRHRRHACHRSRHATGSARFFSTRFVDRQRAAAESVIHAARDCLPRLHQSSSRQPKPRARPVAMSRIVTDSTGPTFSILKILFRRAVGKVSHLQLPTHRLSSVSLKAARTT